MGKDVGLTEKDIQDLLEDLMKHTEPPKPFCFIAEGYMIETVEDLTELCKISKVWGDALRDFRAKE